MALPVINLVRVAYLDWLELHEGGIADRPLQDDPGGLTNRGITMPTLAEYRGHPVTEQDLRSLTREEARAIISTLYWNRCRCDSMPDGINWLVCDFAVNSGARRAVKKLQEVLGFRGEEIDGLVGPKTLAAIAARDQSELIKNYARCRQTYLESLPHYRANKGGWDARVRQVAVKALAIAPPSAPSLTVEHAKSNNRMATAVATVGTTGLTAAGLISTVVEALPAAKASYSSLGEALAPFNLVAPWLLPVAGVAVVLSVIWLHVHNKLMVRNAEKTGTAATLVTRS